MKLAKRLLWVFACLFCLIPLCLPAQYEIEAQVDKNEVAFGESLNLVITITQNMRNGAFTRSFAPDIKEIPGFDIASTRTGHNSSWINGVGITQSQLLLELVPREPGKKEIPAISFKDPEGKLHSTKPIKINVLPPPKDSESADADAEHGSDNRQSKSSLVYRLVLIGGLVFFLLLSIPFIYFVLAKNTPSSSAESNVEDAQIVSVTEDTKVAKEESKTTNIKPVIDFAAEVARLKRQNPDVDSEFYKAFFSLFKRAAVQKTSALSDDMTPDEMLAKIRSMSSSESVKKAGTRIGADIELVMYAGGLPSRSFSAIEEDVKTVLNSID